MFGWRKYCSLHARVLQLLQTLADVSNRARAWDHRWALVNLKFQRKRPLFNTNHRLFQGQFSTISAFSIENSKKSWHIYIAMRSTRVLLSFPGSSTSTQLGESASAAGSTIHPSGSGLVPGSRPGPSPRTWTAPSRSIVARCEYAFCSRHFMRQVSIVNGESVGNRQLYL